MPISGPVVHQQLMDAYAEMQQRLDHARAGLAGTELRDQLDDDRSAALVRLAEHYLPELTPDAVRQTWEEIQPAISRVLLRKQEHVDRMKVELVALNQERGQNDSKLVALNQELDQVLQEQEELATEVEQRLREDSEFAQLSDRAAVAEVALERAEANLEEIDQDSAKKLPGYEDSSLFTYLRDREYGSANYDKRGLTRRMDRWLAKMIDYNKAKQGYDFLRETPERMRQIIAEDRQSLDTVMDELERRRDDVATALGLSEKISQAQEIHGQREELVLALDSLLERTDHVESELNQMEGSRGPYYREAIELFRDMLERSDSRELKRRAERTIEITDDQIVARLMGVEIEIGALENEARRRARDLDRMGSFLEDLGRLIQRFRAAKFDSSRSQFVGSLDVFDAVQRAGEDNDIEDLWKRVRDAQRWGPTAIERVTQVASHPLTQVLINAMAHAAGGAMENHARRAGRRRAQRNSSRNSSRGGGSWSWDSSSGWKRY